MCGVLLVSLVRCSNPIFFIVLSTYPELLHLYRFFLGKTKVSQVALGRSDAEEYREGLHLLSKVNEGNSAASHRPL